MSEHKSDNALAVRLRETVDKLVKCRCYPSREELDQIVSDSNKLFPGLASSTIRILIAILKDSMCES